MHRLLHHRLERLVDEQPLALHARVQVGASDLRRHRTRRLDGTLDGRRQQLLGHVSCARHVRRACHGHAIGQPGWASATSPTNAGGGQTADAPPPPPATPPLSRTCHSRAALERRSCSSWYGPALSIVPCHFRASAESDAASCPAAAASAERLSRCSSLSVRPESSSCCSTASLSCRALLCTPLSVLAASRCTCDLGQSRVISANLAQSRGLAVLVT
mmetsp:Transcript_10859/g.34340  ORF Transcript_10859/g.34340 Transcript_10859/m.34340 type:complete len:217 (-) Transcript_10859:364-1014(-)